MNGWLNIWMRKTARLTISLIERKKPLQYSLFYNVKSKSKEFKISWAKRFLQKSEPFFIDVHYVAVIGQCAAETYTFLASSLRGALKKNTATKTRHTLPHTHPRGPRATKVKRSSMLTASGQAGCIVNRYAKWEGRKALRLLFYSKWILCQSWRRKTANDIFHSSCYWLQFTILLVF